MSLSPIEEVQGRRIGTVEYVSPNEIKVALDLDAPDSTALNAGIPRPFPRINSYLLISSEEGFVVGQVEWLAVERSPFPKRKGLKDFGLVDLPFPLRKLSLNPVGTLVESQKEKNNDSNEGINSRFSLRRGVYTFPTVGDPVIMPTDDQLRDIIESGEYRPILIGHAPLAGNAEVRIDPDKLFGRHLAILGNTGSGKSCTVAGLIRWSIENAREKRISGEPNTRFLLLDPNGEYAKSFKGFPGLAIYKAEVKSNIGKKLIAPIWLWNTDEWSAFALATGKSQKPLIRQTLRALRNRQTEPSEGVQDEIKNFLRIILISSRYDHRKGGPYRGFPVTKGFGQKIEKWLDSIEDFMTEVLDTESIGILRNVQSNIQLAVRNHKDDRGDFSAFRVDEIKSMIETISNAYRHFGGDDRDLLPKHEDVPIPFTAEEFINLIDAIARESDNPQYTEYLIARIKTTLNDTRIRPILEPSTTITLERWLCDVIGKSGTENLTIIDLSLIPTEIVNILTAVIARMVLESLQRYRRLHEHNLTLPTVLIMEEAHTFIKRYKEDADDASSSAACCKVFEKIAREGRKFGLGLVLSSQRPSELSPTVLSQCNSFVLHRISNDRDQEAVNKLLPDNLRGILKELPVLPTRHAFLLGWATELPVLTHIRELTLEQQPQSQDPDFWDVWTGKKDRDVNWESIAKEWQEQAESVDDESTDTFTNTEENSESID
jgi:uncharacterized protein